MTALHTARPARDGLTVLAVLCAVILTGSARSVRAWSEGDIAPIAQITLEAEVAPRPALGATASITFRDGTRWSGAAGSGDQNGKKVVAADQMRIGSQTKTYTGTVILQMVQEGKLSLDDTLLKWLPDSGVPQAGQITIRNLLNMTSGIPDYLAAPAAALSGPCPASPKSTVLDQWVQQFGKMDATPTELITASSCLPSTGLGKMAYSNTNFAILGKIAEKIGCGDKPQPGCYINELKTRVLDRIPGLKATSFPSNADFARGPFSSGYARFVAGTTITGMGSLVNPDANANANFTSVTPPVPYTAGAMISSADDEAIWISQLAGNKFGLLSPEMQRKRLTEVVRGEVAGIPAHYGLAVYYMRSLLNNAEMLGHSGSIVGYTSNVFRRTDNNTDYGANVSTFLLTDQFSAPALVWVLDRNVWGAINSTGNCGPDEAAAAAASRQRACTGDSVRLSTLEVADGLTLQPSGKSYTTYVPAPNGTDIIVRDSPVPTVTFYGHRQSAVALGGSAALTVQSNAALATVGNQSAAIRLRGSGNSVSIDGAVTASGRDTAALSDAGSGSMMTIGGQLTGSAVWWNPDLQFPDTPSVYMVAVPGDASAAVDLAGKDGKLTVNGLVRTQRIKTAAVQLRPETGGYGLSVGPLGTVVGPIVLGGSGNSLTIAPGGLGLYVEESRALAPPTAQPVVIARKTGQLNSLVFRDLPLLPVNDEFVTSGVPGIPPVRKPPTGVRRLSATVPGAAPLALPTPPSTPPPAMLSLQGSRNQATIAGTLVGAIPDDYQSDYTAHVVAVDDGGSENTLTIAPTGIVIGDIVLRGNGTRMHLEGTAKGDVKVMGTSIVVDGNGRIEGRLTINGTAVSQLGGLKIGPAR